MNPDNPNFRTPEEEARAAEFVRMKVEVERQARVLEKLMEQRDKCLEYVSFDVDIMDRELEAIEQGEGM